MSFAHNGVAWHRPAPRACKGRGTWTTPMSICAGVPTSRYSRVASFRLTRLYGTCRGRAPTQGAASARPVRSSSVRAQLVPHAPDGDQAVAEGTKLLAQVANMGVDHSVDAAVLKAPDALQ